MACKMEKKLRTAGQLKPKIRIRIIYNEFGFQVIELGINKILSEEGNNPETVDPGKNLLPGKGAMSLEAIESLAKLEMNYYLRRYDARDFGVVKGKSI